MTNSKPTNLDLPLMKNNIVRADLDRLIEYLSGDDPKLTHGRQVQEFEREWSAWLGVRHSVYVNSGASANLLTMQALKETRGAGEVIVSPLTWVSNIAAVFQAGLTPVFVDIDRRTLGMDAEQVIAKIGKNTRGVFITHILGYSALSRRLLDGLAKAGVPLIEDTCESYGATFEERKLGTFSLMSNFSFYYAHHMSTIEGGMICTDDSDLYQIARMLRSHGLVRESTSPELRQLYAGRHPDLNPEFIFAYPAYNVRPTELGAVIGRSQLARLDENNERRRENLKLFLDNLDPEKFQTDFAIEGSCNYALTLVLRHADPVLCENVMKAMREHGVEFRRGTSGGGNQLRQPYLKRLLGKVDMAAFPVVDFIHFYGFYIGNYPTLESEKILRLCELLNAQAAGR